jgi:hypothetical protein
MAQNLTNETIQLIVYTATCISAVWVIQLLLRGLIYLTRKAINIGEL